MGGHTWHFLGLELLFEKEIFFWTILHLAPPSMLSFCFRLVSSILGFILEQGFLQVQAIRSFELFICYYGVGEYLQRQNKCHSHGVYNAFYFVVAVIPFTGSASSSAYADYAKKKIPCTDTML